VAAAADVASRLEPPAATPAAFVGQRVIGVEPDPGRAARAGFRRPGAGQPGFVDRAVIVTGGRGAAGPAADDAEAMQHLVEAEQEQGYAGNDEDEAPRGAGG